MTVTSTGRTATFRDVFAVREYTALWSAQLLSIAGDQVARIALAVLVYDRTASAALAAVSFAVTAGAQFAGGLGLGWVADRYPRRAVMICCDIICTALILVMTVPGLPLSALIVLLFAVSMAVEPFLSARVAVNLAALGPERFELGNGITMSTYQVAQLAGFAAGGLVVTAAGVRGALAIDAATFAASAVIVRLGVRARPAPEQDSSSGGPGWPGITGGFRAVLAVPAATAAAGLMCLAAFLVAPEGAAVPLGRVLGHGTATTGWLLAAGAAGAAAGPLAWNRYVPAARRTQLAAVLAAASCAVLAAFALPVHLAGALVILFTSGLGSAYLTTANRVIMNAVPDSHRGQACGLVGAGMALSQVLVIITAGAAAGRLGPQAAIAICSAAGTVTAVLLAIRWRAVTASRPGRQEQSGASPPPGQDRSARGGGKPGPLSR
jgi:MFS family permease